MTYRVGISRKRSFLMYVGIFTISRQKCVLGFSLVAWCKIIFVTIEFTTVKVQAFYNTLNWDQSLHGLLITKLRRFKLSTMLLIQLCSSLYISKNLFNIWFLRAEFVERKGKDFSQRITLFRTRFSKQNFCSRTNLSRQGRMKVETRCKGTWSHARWHRNGRNGEEKERGERWWKKTNLRGG